MKSKIIVDTCIWIEFFNAESDVGNALESLISNDSVATCGIILFELMQGIKSETEKSTILNAFSELLYIEMNSNLWQKSAVLSSSLRKGGVTLPLSDIFIAAIALEHKLSIFTLDKHFESIPGISLYKYEQQI